MLLRQYNPRPHFSLQPLHTGGCFCSLQIKGTTLCVKQTRCSFFPILYLAQSVAVHLFETQSDSS